MEEQNILGLVGLAVKAGGVTVGVPLICEALRRGIPGKKPLLIIEASDTSANTHKKMTDKVDFYGVSHVRLKADGETLAKIAGKRGSAVAAVGITEPHLAEAILAKLREPPEKV